MPTKSFDKPKNTDRSDEVDTVDYETAEPRSDNGAEEAREGEARPPTTCQRVLPAEADVRQLPEKFRTIIVLLKFVAVPPLPLTGFIAETADTHEPYFHAYAGRGYDVSLIAKWDYLAEVLPGYCLASGHRKGDRHD